MPLRSFLFAGDARLEACLVDNAAHLTRGAQGEHVRLVQVALGHLDGAVIAAAELKRGHYDFSTSGAVLAFKAKRGIVNRAYQKSADDIVGKMTIAALDAEMLASQRPARRAGMKPHGPARHNSGAESAARRAMEQALQAGLAKLR
jgi:hypothetical protein